MAKLELIASQTVGAGGVSSITFSSIPQTYSDLKLIVSARGSYIYAQANAYLTFNGSSATNYKEHLFYGNGSSVGTVNATTNGYFNWTVMMSGGGATANTFGNSEVNIYNYTDSKYKHLSADNMTENNGTEGWQGVSASQWAVGNPITSITLTADNGSITQYSSFYLYGIKNS